MRFSGSWTRSLPSTIDAVGHRSCTAASASPRRRHRRRGDAAIEALAPLAPLHNPPDLAGIRAARAALPDVPQVAVFDTAFHADAAGDARARTRSTPSCAARARHPSLRIPRHVVSASWRARAAGSSAGRSTICSSSCCTSGTAPRPPRSHGGRSVDTSMGLTPLEGLVMGTRAGDIDPASARYTCSESAGSSVDELDALLNRGADCSGSVGTRRHARHRERRRGGR